MIEVRTNAGRVAADLAEYIHETHQSEAMAVRMAAKSVVGHLLKLTPPLQSLSPTESFGVQRRVGELAVKRDLSRAFKTISDLRPLIASTKPLVFKKMQKAVQKKDSVLMAQLLTNLKYPDITSDRIVNAPDDKLHDSLRVKGRVPKGTKAYFVFERMNEYAAMVLARIGRAKAGWLDCAYDLGVPAPDWIVRQGTAEGEMIWRNGDDPYVGGINNVDYIVDAAVEGRIIELALAREADSLERQLIAKRKGLWHKKG